MKKAKKGQNLLEYVLIAMLMAVFGFIFVSKVDLKAVKNYVFVRPTDGNNIKIEAMTK